MKSPRLLAAAILPLALGACSETRFLIEGAKEISGATEPAAKSVGQYKVGNPYQIAGTWYYPAEDFGYVETGIASWYGPQFHAKTTANGETFDMNTLTAAHRTLPMPSVVRVTNLENGRALMLRVNDRGPFARGRIIDVSRRAAQLLGFQRSGTAKVRVEIVPDESRRLKQLAMQGTPVRDQKLAGLGSQATETGLQTASLEPLPAAAPSKPVDVRPLPPAPGPAAAPVVLPEKVETVAPAVSTRLYVQAGAFLDYANAEKVRSMLTKHGSARVSETQVGSQKFYRVRVGPLGTVNRADAVLDRVVASGYPQAHIVVD
jgi:rare lipoprotein A